MFVHRLALALGKTINELNQQMSSDEFMDWVAYYEIEPWGDVINGLRAASNTAAIYNAALLQTNPKKYRTTQFKAKDFYVGTFPQSATDPKDWEYYRDKISLLSRKG